MADTLATILKRYQADPERLQEMSPVALEAIDRVVKATRNVEARREWSLMRSLMGRKVEAVEDTKEESKASKSSLVDALFEEDAKEVLACEEGDVVLYRTHGANFGVVRYVGEVSGSSGAWVGIERLSEGPAPGDCGGLVGTDRYFVAEKSRGDLVRACAVQKKYGFADLLAKLSKTGVPLAELPEAHLVDDMAFLAPLEAGTGVLVQGGKALGVVRGVQSPASGFVQHYEVEVLFPEAAKSDQRVQVSPKEVTRAVTLEDVGRWIVHATLQAAGLAEQDLKVDEADAQAAGKKRTVVVFPSYDFDDYIWEEIAGFSFYEERYLHLMLRLRDPNLRMAYCLSNPLAECIVEYYLSLLDLPLEETRSRLFVPSCFDSSQRPLSAKVLERPLLQRRIQHFARQRPGDELLMRCLIGCPAVDRVSSVLGLPVHSPTATAHFYGSKAGSRQIFRDAHIPHPLGTYEAAFTPEQVVTDVLYVLRAFAMASSGKAVQAPALPWDLFPSKLVLKTNEGSSGAGNAILRTKKLRERFESAGDCSDEGKVRMVVLEALANDLEFVASTDWKKTQAIIRRMGMIVEVWVDGCEASPTFSGQVHEGYCEARATHDQILDGQVFLGCRFPAHERYRMELLEYGLRMGEMLRRKGGLQFFITDFVARQQGGRWELFAVEINLRWGGSTNQLWALEQLIPGGRFDLNDGLWYAPNGQKKFYVSNDYIKNKALLGLTPEDAIDAVREAGLHWDKETQKGVVLHMLSAVSTQGKIGGICYADSPEEANALHEKLNQVLMNCQTEA